MQAFSGGNLTESDNVQTPNQHGSEVSKYQMLHERGVKLNDKKIDFIVKNLTTGMNYARVFLNRVGDDPLIFIASDNLNTIGYAPQARAINLPVEYFNKITEIEQPLENHQIEFNLSLRAATMQYPLYLKAVGMEEVVHHYQREGHPELKAEPNDDLYMRLSAINKLLSDYEVEARRKVDEICTALWEKPIWYDFDNHLNQNFPNNYNRPIRVLAIIQGLIKK